MELKEKGNLEFKKKNYKKALEFYFQGYQQLKKENEDKNEKLISIILCNISLTFFFLDDFVNSEKYSRKSLIYDCNNEKVKN
jgi:hypothetical protein